MAAHVEDLERRRRALGEQLAARRQAAELTQRQLARQVGYSRPSVAGVENGKQQAAEEFWRRCDEVLGAGGALLAGWRDLRAARVRREREAARRAERERDERIASWRAEQGLPATTSTPTNRAGFVSGLDDGAMQLVGVVDGRLVVVPLDRRLLVQALIAAGFQVGGLAGRPADPPRTVSPAIIEHFRQLRAVLVDADNLLGPRHCLSTVQQQLRIIDEMRRHARGGLRMDLLATQARWAEFAGWLSDDVGDSATGAYWADQSMEMTQEVGDDGMASYVLARKAQRAVIGGDDERVVAFARAAQRMINDAPLTWAFAALQEAHGHALAGNAATCQRKLDDAYASVASEDRPAHGDLGSFCSINYVQMQEAECWLRMGQPARAVATFVEALEGWPEIYTRDRGLCQARLAAAYLACSEVEQAAVVGLQAFNCATELGSFRVRAETERLAAKLQRWRGRDEVDEFLNTVASAAAQVAG